MPQQHLSHLTTMASPARVITRLGRSRCFVWRDNQAWDVEIRGNLRRSCLPIFVMASTDGRYGILGSKSGQRVAGSSNVDGRSKPLNLLVPSVPGCWIARTALFGDPMRVTITNGGHLRAG